MAESKDEELERKMRERLFPGGKSKLGTDAVSDLERRMAEKLIGRDNAERLEKHKGVGRFRPTPVQVHYEWWWLPSTHHLSGNYHLARIENGRQIPHWDGYSREDLDNEIAKLKVKGCSVRRFILAGEPGELELKKAKASQRRSNLDQLAGFKAGGRT